MLRLIALMALASLFVGAALAQGPAPVSSTTGSGAHADVEQQKLSIEREKLQEEKNATRLTLLTIIVTALIGFGTFIYNIRNNNYQALLQARLKAIEVVTNANGPTSARQRLHIVSYLLGEDLVDKSLVDGLTAEGVGKGHDESRRELIEMLLKYPDRRAEVLDLWEVAFGRSKLNENIQAMRKLLLK